MKKIKLTGKLSLNKETIAKLNDDQMNSIKGGELTENTCAVTQCVLCPPKTGNLCPVG